MNNITAAYLYLQHNTMDYCRFIFSATDNKYLQHGRRIKTAYTTVAAISSITSS